MPSPSPSDHLVDTSAADRLAQFDPEMFTRCGAPRQEGLLAIDAVSDQINKQGLVKTLCAQIAELGKTCANETIAAADKTVAGLGALGSSGAAAAMAEHQASSSSND
jgi:hypothetical protein